MVNPTPPGDTAVFNVAGVAATVWQTSEVATPPQPPVKVNNCILGLRVSKSAPIELSVIKGKALCATKLYHTSGEFALPHAGNPAVAVARINVPEVFEQTVLLVREMAPVHRSFPGGPGTAVTQISKSATPFVPDGFTPKFATLI